MKKWEELINKYCPNGVRYAPLSSIAAISRGKVISKDYIKDNEGIYPVYSSQSENDGVLGRIDTYMYDGEYLTWTTDGAYAGTVFRRSGKFNITNVCGLVTVTDQLVNQDFLYYWLYSEAPKYVYRGMGNPKLMSNVMGTISVPIPPLSVQEEIVRVLDTFSMLQSELGIELQKRVQQFNYYRDVLLSFEGRADVKWGRLEDLGDFYSGLTGKSKEDFQNGNAKFITYVNIFNNPSLVTDVEDKVKIFEGEKQNTIQYGDILFTGSSETPDECGMCSVLTHHTEEKLYLNSFCFGFRFYSLSGINPNFMKFLFRSTAIRKLICKTANGVTRYNVSKKEFAKIVIPIPPIEVQNQIATVLDKFYSLVGDDSIGLPAEIEKRRQQYEYYRDKLLTFKRKEA